MAVVSQYTDSDTPCNQKGKSGLSLRLETDALTPEDDCWCSFIFILVTARNLGLTLHDLEKVASLSNVGGFDDLAVMLLALRPEEVDVVE